MSLIYLLSFYAKIFSSDKNHKIVDNAFTLLGSVLVCLYIYFIAKGTYLYGYLNNQTMWFEMIAFFFVTFSRFYFKKENNLERVFFILPFAFYNLTVVTFLISLVAFGDVFNKIKENNFGVTSKKVFTLSSVYTFLALTGFVQIYTWMTLLFPIFMILIVMFDRQKDYLLFSGSLLTALLIRNLDGVVFTLVVSLYLLIVMALLFYKTEIKIAFYKVSKNLFIERLRVFLRTFFEKKERAFSLLQKRELKKDRPSQYVEMSFRYENTIRSSIVLIFLVLSGISIFYLLHLKSLL